MKKVLLLLSSLSFLILSEKANANPVNALYKKTINNIVDNGQCSEQEFLLNIPRQISDDDEIEQNYSSRFTSNVFVDFFKEDNKIVSIDISIAPVPKTLSEQLPAFCIISSIQAAIDPSRTKNEYMQLDSKLYSSALKSGKYEYSSKNYDHSSFLVGSSPLVYRIESRN
ncbi:hypothetical protein [Xenorhabdus bovienii]|uniref:hypothetical protein n=1 Tax=Xenorhabdus bovienii TaxID=40576 RepID=UPI003DA64F8C